MANTATRWLDLCNAITAGMRATAGYRSPLSTEPGIPVYHTIEIGMQSESGQAVPVMLIIGWPGDPDTPTETGRTTQTVATLGTNRHRQEDGQIECRVIAQTGNCALSDTDLTAADTAPGLLRTAFAVIDAVDAFIRSDPSVGALAPTMVARIAGLPMIQPMLFEKAGMTAEVDFTVSFSARI